MTTWLRTVALRMLVGLWTAMLTTVPNLAFAADACIAPDGGIGGTGSPQSSARGGSGGTGSPESPEKGGIGGTGAPQSQTEGGIGGTGQQADGGIGGTGIVGIITGFGSVC